MQFISNTHRRIARTSILGLIAMVIVCAELLDGNIASAQAPTPTSIVIKLSSGRFVFGIIDSNTNDNALWLRREEPGIQLRTSHQWSNIMAAKIGNDVFDSTAMKAAALKLKTVPPILQKIAVTNESQNIVTQQDAPSVENHFDNRVQSLTIHAELANWDSDPEPDGLRVYVLPYNAKGELVPINGDIELTLTSQFQAVAVTHERRITPEFKEIASAKHPVRETDFARGAAVYKIPFNQDFPEQEFNLVPLGIVTARLGINMQGVVNASESDVVLRKPSYLRDHLQYRTDRRSLPRER